LEGVNPYDLKDVPIFDGVNHPLDKKKWVFTKNEKNFNFIYILFAHK
jgi:hypothetical protein